MQIIGEDHVFLQKRTGIEVFQFVYRILQRLLRQIGVDIPESRQQLAFVQRRVIVPLNVRAVGIGIAQGLGEELQDGVFIIGFGEGH